jgi:transcriptional regulator with XRE-family HTH domain
LAIKYSPEIGNRLQKSRLKLNLTQKQFAESIGFKCSYVKAVEAGNLNPSIKFLIAWKKKAKTTYEYILEGKS